MDPVAFTPEASPATKTTAQASARNSISGGGFGFGRFFSSWLGSSNNNSSEKAQEATKLTPEAYAIDADGNPIAPVSSAKKGKKIISAKKPPPDALTVPVPEAAVAALGDTAGQLFVAPPSPSGGGIESTDSTDSPKKVNADGRNSNTRSSSRSSSRSGRNHGSDEVDVEEYDEDHMQPRSSEAMTLSDFDRIKVLGKGSFGKVVLVERKDKPGTRYAMKVLKKSKLRRVKQVERTQTERRVLEVCKHHPFIMSMFSAFQTEEKLYIVLEYCSGGELFFHLSRFRKFPEHVARFYAAELALALEFLHRNGVIYRDMKPENVLLDSDGHVKLGDFGLAKDNIWDPCQGARSICGTPEYMAPEVLNKVGHGHSVDWWGLGMILYEMLTGLPPWYTKDRQKLFQRLRYSPLRIPPTMSVECASVVSAFLCRDPAERLGANGVEAIKAHPFFNPRHSVAPVQAPSSSSGEPQPFPRAAPTSDGFNWPDLQARKMKPPIDPMEGIEMSADDRDNTANFDPQFTNLEIESDIEGSVDQEKFEHFDGFSFIHDDSDSGGSGDDDDIDGSISHAVSSSVDSESGLEIAVDATGKKVMMLPARKKNKQEVASEGDVLIDPKPMGVDAMEQQIRKLSSASSMNSSRPASTDSLGLPLPPPPSEPHPDDVAAAAMVSSSEHQPLRPPSNPLLLTDLGESLPLAAVPGSQTRKGMGTSQAPFEFVTCKMCGDKVLQSMEAIEAHVCST